MARAVIDTTVASILHVGGPHHAFYAERTHGVELAISFQTVEEMLYGAYRASWGERRLGGLEAFLHSMSVVAGRWEVAVASARVRVEAETLGRRLEADDAWIVATAVQLGVPLITDDQDQILAGLTGYRFISRHGSSPGLME